MIYLIIVIYSIMLMFSSLSYAEQQEAKLEEIVVTATRTEKEVEFAPASVSVVTK